MEEEGDIYRDLDTLFEECDNVSNIFYQSIASDSEQNSTAIDLKQSQNGKLTKVENLAVLAQSNDKCGKSCKEGSAALQTTTEKNTPTGNRNISSRNSVCQHLNPNAERNNEISKKRSWKLPSPSSGPVESSPVSMYTSREEGELTPSVIEDESDSVNADVSVNSVVMIRKEYPTSFIDTSKEEGECTATDLEDDLDATVIDVKTQKESPQKKLNFVPVAKRVHMDVNDVKNHKQKELGKRHTFMTHIFNSRKRSLDEGNENTPKRHKIFDTESQLSPILCASDEKCRKFDSAETPQIESKFTFTDTGVCSSTPVAKTPGKSDAGPDVKSSKSKFNKKLKLKIENDDVKSEDGSDFSCFSDIGNLEEDREKTFDELIDDITHLIEDSADSSDELYSEAMDGEESKQCFSKINVEDLITDSELESKTVNHSVIVVSSFEESGLKTKSKSSDQTVVENSAADDTLKENDKTLIELDVDVNKNLHENLKRKITDRQVDSADNRYNDERVMNLNDSSKKKSGRFQAEVTLIRIEDGQDSQRIQDEEDVFENDGADVLNLDDYDDEEGYIDAKDLEKSHLRKDINLNLQAEEKTEIVKPQTETVSLLKAENDENKVDVVMPMKPSSLDKQTSENSTCINKATGEHQKKEGDRNFLKFAPYDDKVYRKEVECEFEYKVCQIWGTSHPPNPDVNLTVATTYRNQCNVTDLKTHVGFLEGEKVVCTHLYEDEILSKFENYGQTDGQSKLCCMSVETVLEKLYHQTNIIEDMHKTNLMMIQQDTQWKLNQMHSRFLQEENDLKERQQAEFDNFRFSSLGMYNPRQMAFNLSQLRQEHSMQMRQMKARQRQRYTTFSQQRREILDVAKTEYKQQIQPIEDLISQLQNPEHLSSSPSQKYGPPIVVSLRKGPCKASNWKHSTVTVCLSAAIAQAVSLEDDLYDHYYSY